MKVSFMVPCRDKEHFIRQTATSVLNQTYPCEILLSDQGSTDNSLEIMRDLAFKYDGEHKVRVVQCPHTDVKGMAGFNVHMNWLHTQTDADIIVMTSADDWSHPHRVAYCVKAFEEHQPDLVATCIEFWDGQARASGEVTAFQNDGGVDGWVDPRRCLEMKLGGSSAHAWTRDFYDAVGGLPDVCGYDVFWPFLATARKGLWFIQKPLHAYIRWENEANTGLEGIMRASEPAKVRQLEELAHFQMSVALWDAAVCLDKWGVNDERFRQPLYETILAWGHGWTKSRLDLTVQKINPMPLAA